MNKGLGVIVGLAIVCITALAVGYNSLVGHNDSGQRQFIQTYMGKESIEYSPGPFALWFGTSVSYNDVLTLNNSNGECSYAKGNGFPVQYSDGGKGVICVQAQFPLPTDPETMLALHKRFRSEEGVRSKLMDATLRSLFTNTAKLYTSPEAYSTKSTDIQEDINEQIINGGFLTEIEVRKVASGVDKNGNTIYQDKDFAVKAKGEHKYSKNPLSEFNMNTAVKVQILGFDFEQKTIDQIGERRDAANRAQTAQDAAKAAYWETEKEKADGEKQRVIEEFKQKKIAEGEIQQAEKVKRLALIRADQSKEEAEKLEGAAVAATAQKTEELKQAKIQAEITITTANAEAYAIEKKLQADLPRLKLQTQREIEIAWAKAVSNMKVPTTLMNSGSGDKSSSEMQQLLQLQVLDKLKTQGATK